MPLVDHLDLLGRGEWVWSPKKNDVAPKAYAEDDRYAHWSNELASRARRG